MPLDIPYRFPATGYAEAPHVQADFDKIVSDLSLSFTTTGDVIVLGAGKGLVVTTPDGLHTYRIAISNDGSVTTEQIT